MDHTTISMVINSVNVQYSWYDYIPDFWIFLPNLISSVWVYVVQIRLVSTLDDDLHIIVQVWHYVLILGIKDIDNQYQRSYRLKYYRMSLAWMWVGGCVFVGVSVSVYASEAPQGLIAPCDHTLLGFDSQL